LSYPEWRLLRGKGDARIELDLDAVRRWFRFCPEDAAFKIAALLPPGGARRRSDAADATRWWADHSGCLRDLLYARGLHDEDVRSLLSLYTGAVRESVDAIHEARRAPEQWNAAAVGAALGLFVAEDKAGRGGSGNG